MSPAVCDFPREVLLKGMMLIFSSVVNKKIYTTSHITFYTLHVYPSQEKCAPTLLLYLPLTYK
jgi:hypothetical protein